LLVRKAVKADGSLGLGSGWLIRDCALGGVVKLRLRPNPNFHPPDDGPQILIGAGTGIAGLRAHLFHRQQNRLGDAWLLFGERTGADLFYQDDLKAWQADGTLARTDLVFSRGCVPKKYVPHLVAEQGEEIGRWVRERGASILVCGGFAMAASVQEALAAILGEERLDQMTQDGLYRRDIY
jgi:sulfite reductase (NADPH) flavoprotein alpha-component